MTKLALVARKSTRSVGFAVLGVCVAIASVQAVVFIWRALTGGTQMSFWTDPCAEDIPTIVGFLLTLLVSAALLLVTASLIGTDKWRRPMKLALTMVGIFIALGLLPLVIVATPRHGPAWQAARDEVARLAELASSYATVDEQLIGSDWERVRPLVEQEARAITIDGWPEPVRVRLSTGYSPYVALDLGSGKTMQVDPTTMRCIYSD